MVSLFDVAYYALDCPLGQEETVASSQWAVGSQNVRYASACRRFHISMLGSILGSLFVKSRQAEACRTF